MLQNIHNTPPANGLFNILQRERKKLKPQFKTICFILALSYRYGAYRSNIHTLRGLDTFAQYSHFRLALLRPKTPPKGYPINPQVIGEHIRKRRLDLGLLQIEVALQISVTESTVWNWSMTRRGAWDKAGADTYPEDYRVSWLFTV
jgi:hypothetical protein